MLFSILIPYIYYSIAGLINLVEEPGMGEHNKQIFEYLKQTIEKLDDVIYEINNITKP